MKFILALMLTLPAAAANTPKARADAETVKLAEQFIKAPADKLPLGSIEFFMALDAETLPIKLQTPFKAKRLGIKTGLRLSEGAKKGNFRMTSDKHCEQPEDEKNIQLLAMVGYAEISQDEKEHLEERTKCTEQDMLCEFTLKIVNFKRPDKTIKHRYFLHSKDPLMMLVDIYRRKLRDNSTNFFGSGGGPTCHHS